MAYHKPQGYNLTLNHKKVLHNHKPTITLMLSSLPRKSPYNHYNSQHVLYNTSRLLSTTITLEEHFNSTLLKSFNIHDYATCVQ